MGRSKAAVARTFGIRLNIVKCPIQRWRQTGDLALTPIRGSHTGSGRRPARRHPGRAGDVGQDPPPGRGYCPGCSCRSRASPIASELDAAVRAAWWRTVRAPAPVVFVDES
jgi:hypothetical protein